MGMISDAKDLVTIIKIVKSIFEKNIFCKNTKNVLNAGYKETIILNKFFYPFQIEKRCLFQLFITDIIIFLLNELIVCNLSFNIDIFLKFAILVIQLILIFDLYNEFYKENLLFLYERKEDIKIPNIIILIHVLLYICSMVLVIMPITYENKIGMFLIVITILYLIITIYILKKENKVKNKTICRTDFVPYCNIYLTNIHNKIYKIDMSSSNILIKNNDDIYVYIKEQVKKDELLRLYNVNIELIKESLNIERKKINYIEIGKKKIIYSDGQWTMKN